MRLRLVRALALALVLALVPAAAAEAGQAKKKTRTIDATLLVARIGDNGPSGSMFAGRGTGAPFGVSALLAKNTVSGSTSTGKAVVYNRKGTIRVNIENQIQPQPDGTILLPGTFEITGGTGRYRGARGSGDFNGTWPAGSEVLTFEVDGKVRY